MEKNRDNLSILPELFADAVTVNFDTKSGIELSEDTVDHMHNYLNDQTISRIPWTAKASELNILTAGGLKRKNLNIIQLATGKGKSLIKCDYSADAVRQNKNVFYFTLELSEEDVIQRLYANLFNETMQSVDNMKKDQIKNNLIKVKRQYGGRFLVKQLPSAYASAGNINSEIKKLTNQYGIVPDVVVIDYLTLLVPHREQAKKDNTYVCYKAVAEELRGLSVKHNVVMLTSIQVNRGNMNSTNLGLSGMADSIAVAHTADVVITVYKSNEDEESEMGSMTFNLRKTRSSANTDKFCNMYISPDHMRVRNLSDKHKAHGKETLLKKKREALRVFAAVDVVHGKV